MYVCSSACQNVNENVLLLPYGLFRGTDMTSDGRNRYKRTECHFCFAQICHRHTSTFRGASLHRAYTQAECTQAKPRCTRSLESGNYVYFITTMFSGLHSSAISRRSENWGVYSYVGSYISNVGHAASNCQWLF